MIHLRALEPLPHKNIWATIGNFDGVHVGHQALIHSMVQQAHKVGSSAVAITFYPNPVVVLRKIEDPVYLTSPEEKATIFESLGLDYTITLPFTHEFAALSAEEFILQLLNNYSIKQFWVGEDFTFGHHRSGNTDVLAQLGKKYGFTTVVFPHKLQDSEKISSSEIRKYLNLGEMKAVTKELGRPYSVSGIVKQGDQRGRTIGFPTANLEIWEHKLLPPAGVYATFALVEGSLYHSVTNIGYRPTFIHNQKKPMVETYIHHFDKNIYDLPVKLFLIERIRPEQKFESVTALINQIQRDVYESEEILSHAEIPSSLFTGSPKTTT